MAVSPCSTNYFISSFTPSWGMHPRALQLAGLMHPALHCFLVKYIKQRNLWFQVGISSSSSKFSSKFFANTSLGLPSEMGRFTQRERCNLALGPLGHVGKATAPSPRMWWVHPVDIGYDQIPAFKQTLPVITSQSGQQSPCLCYGISCSSWR